MERLKSLYERHFGVPAEATERIASEGSGRGYYRLSGPAGRVIGTLGTSMTENRAFVALSQWFGRNGLPVPRVLEVDDEQLSYLQTDAGNSSLYDLIAAGKNVEPELHRLMELLPRFHYCATGDFDSSVCFPRKAMDRRAVMWDLNYFKYVFLKPSGVEFDEDRLEDDFEALAEEASANPESTLMLRDFQSRNVIVDADGELTVIDFQGARMGDGLYDVASFVWQARAGFPADLRERLVATYRRASEALTGCVAVDFDRRLDCMVLLRLLQVLGAYGYRGLFERKARFIESIPAAIDNLRELLERWPQNRLSYLRSVLERMVEVTGGEANDDEDGLTVTVISFSYKKGVPQDNSGNGGGFVFDCRGMHNPGRYERYKRLTGMDADVIEFLEERGEIQPFMEYCYGLVDASVECYLRRGFTRLMVCFGCTGGQHRSVYGAEHMARHLNEKYGVRVRLIHREQGIDRKLEPR